MRLGHVCERSHRALQQRWQFTPARRAVLAVRRALCMIGPVVEEVDLRRMPVAVAVASLTAVARAARGHDGGRRLRGRGHGQRIPSVAGGVELRPETVKNMLAIAGDLGRWMDSRDVAPGRVDRCVIAEFS
jgi:hypothetical protein